MYGDNVDRFLIYVSAGNNPSRIVFDLSGNQGNAWRQASAAVRLSFFDQVSGGVRAMRPHFGD